jgi:hypothetical protein
MFGPTGAFIMVNPSTADASQNDQTIRKVLGFATRFGWSRVIVGNVFAYRATDISELGLVGDPVGPDNAVHLRNVIREADEVVCAWGSLAKLPPHLRGQWRSVSNVADELNVPLKCLQILKDGHPKHPLMASYSMSVTDWVLPSGS